MSAKFKRMEFVKELQLRPRIKLELASGEIFSVDYLPHDVADELVRRWNAYEDRDAIPPREPTEAMLEAPWQRMVENYPKWEPSETERGNIRYGWIAMYDAALAEKEGK